ncbi:hypothetical protein HYT58_02430 [Candidatus Woesearchaeota archaeon]|nr:hypothetical protein [Candidatus Woesearchaeota archaeon]
MDKIVWQPIALHQPSYEFGIILDETFAKEMVKTNLSQESQRRMNDLGTEVITRFGHNWTIPYIFHENTAFVSQFSLGVNGVWLALDNWYDLLKIPENKDPIKYSSHNVDTSSQAYSLMALVDFWVEYAETLKGL